LAETLYSGVVILFTTFFVSIKWLWRKLFRINSFEDGSFDAEYGVILAKRNREDFLRSK
jgi:hypothetical protein